MIQLSAIISWNTFFSLKILTARRKLKQKKVGLSYHIISLDFNDINFEKLLFFSQKSIIIDKNEKILDIDLEHSRY